MNRGDARRPALTHLAALTDEVGVIQHATYDIPNRSTGYCTDDVARAFIVTCLAGSFPALRAEAERLGRIYLSFLFDAQRGDGRFHNFMSYERRWLDETGTEDSNGRAIWALGVGARSARREGWRELCGSMLAKALPAVSKFRYPRARAFAALGIVEAIRADVEPERGRALLSQIAEGLQARFRRERRAGWDWFENELTYDNARLCEALIRIGSVCEDPEAAELGLRTLRFYERVVFDGATFVPIGNQGWYVRGGERALYGQQPLEATATIDAELAAYEATGDMAHRAFAGRALAWFFGENSRGLPLVLGDGCRDGLEAYGPNANMGAESTLAYLAGALVLARPRRSVVLRAS
ncbi:MAG: hypothetical protein ABI346_06875 [Candidatus Baltobacteraceae bacterium]